MQPPTALADATLLLTTSSCPDVHPLFAPAVSDNTTDFAPPCFLFLAEDGLQIRLFQVDLRVRICSTFSHVFFLRVEERVMKVKLQGVSKRNFLCRCRYPLLVLVYLPLRDDTPLHSAAIDGRLDEVVSILAGAADDQESKQMLSKQNQSGETALYVAAEAGRVEIIRELIKCYDPAVATIKARKSSLPHRRQAREFG